MSFGPGSTFEVQVGDAGGNAAPAAGSDYDQLVVNGTGGAVTITDGATLNVLPLAGVAAGQTFTVLDQTGGGTLSGIFRDPSGNPLPEGGTFTAAGQPFAISYANGDVTLTATAAPEPAAAGLLAAGGLGGLLLRRRRRRR